MKRLYRRFCAAVRRHDAAAVEALIRDFPELHHYEGDAGGLMQVLDEEAPDLLEVDFAAGLHPDAGQANTPQTVLQKAACTGNLEKLRLLLRYGADPEKRNDVRLRERVPGDGHLLAQPGRRAPA